MPCHYVRSGSVFASVITYIGQAGFAVVIILNCSGPDDRCSLVVEDCADTPGMSVQHACSVLLQQWQTRRSAPRSAQTDKVAQRLAMAGRVCVVMGGLASLLPQSLLLVKHLEDRQLLEIRGVGLVAGAAWVVLLSEAVFHGLRFYFRRHPTFLTSIGLLKTPLPGATDKTPVNSP